MTDKSTLLKTFNAQFFAFLDDIISIYPENRELQKGKKSFELIKMANASMIIKVWYSHIYSLYANEIENGDVDFFITKDYSNDLQVWVDIHVFRPIFLPGTPRSFQRCIFSSGLCMY